ncbi:MAG: glycosyltransferase [Candidatus Dormibacteraceae bacterium]
MRFLRRLALGHSLKFVAHSPAIAEHVGRHLGLQPTVIALPFKVHDLEERPPCRNRPIRFVFLGLGHRSKGLDLVLEAIGLSADLITAMTFAFTVQCYLPFRDRRSEQLHRDASDLSKNIVGVELIDHELSPSEYFRELRRADVVLIPHRLEIYKLALSGVFADAVGAGRPVIVAEGSYMSELVRKSGAGVCFESGNGPALKRAMVDAVGQIDQLLDKATAARVRWVEEQGPEAFVSGLLLQVQDAAAGSARG